MADARSKNPVVGDVYAERLLGKEGMAYWQDFQDLSLPNGSNVARCFLIDEYLRKLMAAHPATTIILIGAGLDSRAFRLAGGNWIEFDEPQLIEYKNEVLPQSECKNPLQRISIDFEREKLADKLALMETTEQIVVIIEGVIMYLSAEQKAELFNTLTGTLGRHFLLCDLMTKSFFDRLAKNAPLNKKLARHGAAFQDMISDPVKLVTSYGYQLLEKQSTVDAANKFGLNSLPRFIVAGIFRRLFMGYSTYMFEYLP